MPSSNVVLEARPLPRGYLMASGTYGLGLKGPSFSLESCSDNYSSPSHTRKIIKLVIILIIILITLIFVYE